MEMMFGSLFVRRVLLVLAAVAALLLIKEIVSYVFSSWLAFCVFYTTSDLYRKRKYAIKYYKWGKKYAFLYFGIVPQLKTKKTPKTAEKLSLCK